MESLHIMGCMLYWSEGYKNRNTFKMTNSDKNMLCLFMRFLRECYGISNNEISLYIQCYTDCFSVDYIEKYWLKELNLPNSCLRKTQVDVLSKYSHKKRCGKLKYGTCSIVVHCSTEILHNVFGAIQEYGNFINKKWLF